EVPLRNCVCLGGLPRPTFGSSPLTIFTSLVITSLLRASLLGARTPLSFRDWVEQSRDSKPAKRVRKASIASLLFCFISLFLEGVSLLRRNRFPVNFGGQKMQEVSIAAALLAGEIDFSQGYAHRFPVFFPVLPRKVGPKSPSSSAENRRPRGAATKGATRRRGRALRSQAIPPPDRDCS